MAWSPANLFISSLYLLTFVVSGCATSRPAPTSAEKTTPTAPLAAPTSETTPAVVQASHQQFALIDKPDEAEIVAAPIPLPATSLQHLEQIALDLNPGLTRLMREYQAAAARSNYVGKLPDPRLGGNVFGDPIETASGSQRAVMTVSQMLPWLGKLKAEEQRASLEALAIRAEYAAERLHLLAAVRTGWYRLYVIDRQIEIILANQELLRSLIDVANARVATGAASQGDVLLGTLELSQLQERLLTYRRQRIATEAELNRLTARPANTPIDVPAAVEVGVTQLKAEELFQFALNSQPTIEATRLRIQASLWGVEVARLSRRPEITMSANYFFTDDNRPPSTIVDVGADPWALGVQVSVPIWHDKYNAMEQEANAKHMAAHDSLEAAYQRYDALILDLLTEGERAADTARLYQSTILPQAEQTLQADQEAYTTGKVEFDRVVRDYRNLLTLEFGYHQAVGDLGTATAKLQQATGQDSLPLKDQIKARPPLK